MPARERGQQEESEESEYNGDDEEVGKDYGILKGLCHPDQIQWVLVDRHQVGEGGSVLVAEESTSSRSYADSKVSHPNVEVGITDNVGYCCRHSWINLCG